MNVSVPLSKDWDSLLKYLMLLEHFHFAKALFQEYSFDKDFEMKGSGGDYTEWPHIYSA